ncbi:MAG: AAA family ATPase [Mollicutes bacterium]|nr:AAA family ATPase [Mollicutes bacterium]
MIKVITGAMFSGKSFELIELLRQLDMDTVEIFKPNIDTRDKGIVKSRNTNQVYEALLIDDLAEIPQYIDKNVKTIVIDEAQFLKGDVSIIMDLHLQGYDFIIAGLNLTSERKPFGLMKDIMCIATDIEILKAKCICCDRINADYTYSIKNKKEDILIGEYYVPICRECLERKLLNG